MLAFHGAQRRLRFHLSRIGPESTLVRVDKSPGESSLATTQIAIERDGIHGQLGTPFRSQFLGASNQLFRKDVPHSALNLLVVFDTEV
jgi:hypothetical protein